MATIFYSVMGEGRGHAARARTMIEQLRGRHRIVVYTSLDALEFLRAAYPTPSDDVEIRATEGMKFHYTAGKIDLAKTIYHGLGMWWRLSSLLEPIVADIDRDRPSLVISDFEPLVARAAHRRKVPVVSLDHQHFLVAYDLSTLPWNLQLYAWSMTGSVRAFGIGQQHTIISAFYKPPLRRAWRSAIQVGPLLRPALRNVVPTAGHHILSYLRRNTPPQVVDLLVQLDRPIRIYGLGEQPPRGQVTFHAVDEEAFTRDLIGAQAVIAAAGNQLLGEALYFGKPVLALPEEKHHEQCINAHFLKQLGGGDWQPLEHVKLPQVQQFCQQMETFRTQLAGRSAEFDGTPRATEAIESILSQLRDPTS